VFEGVIELKFPLLVQHKYSCTSDLTSHGIGAKKRISGHRDGIFKIQVTQRLEVNNFAVSRNRSYYSGDITIINMLLEAFSCNIEGNIRHIDDGDIAGVVAAVARDGKIVYFEALGYLDLENAIPMPADALFRTYSMTRPITSAAVLMLYEQGKFQFDDPIKQYLPEFEDQKVLRDPNSTDLRQVRNRIGDITVAHLLTHTSGLGSRGSRLYRENNVRDKNITLSEMVTNAARVPLFHDPGTQFRYGIHATILGKLVEVWSGQLFEEYLQEHLLNPLGMDSTMFWAPKEDLDRLSVVYRPVDGRLLSYQIETIPYTLRPRLIEGGVGLLSSVMDFMRFSQMILDGGLFNGDRILQEETVALIYENAVPDQSIRPTR
jgi:CubicO group peptidase (beta-lactamase class C family)